MRPHDSARRTWRIAWLLAALLLCVDAADVSAQLGALVSPGRLTRAHASLEGVGSCLKCHSAGRQVAAEKCLACHAPVAVRIAQKKGIHRQVRGDCITCHVEHAGEDAELRPFDLVAFDHGRDAAFPLDGLHAPLAARCDTCHRTRSFLALNPECRSCHADIHKGALGPACATCHTTAIRFAETRTKFDHSRTAFPLTGAHTPVACAACHVNAAAYRGVKFASCANCHADPHEKRYPQACASCHTTEAWRTTRIDHSKTAFPLRGRHASVACAACHVQPATRVKPRADTCAACHADPHKGTFKQDCRACHDESSFRKGTFDHGQTRFPLTDRHAAIACAACHTSAAPPPNPRPAGARTAKRGAVVHTVDFRGLATACESCHKDPHRGELGAACETCHSARTFKRADFRHAGHGPFFLGGHAAVRCTQCHAATFGDSPARAARSAPAIVRIGFKNATQACASCHRDVHLGQVGAACERCHAVDAARFAVVGFAHDRAFALTGKHAAAACGACHRVRTGAFPAAAGTARQLNGIGTTCVSCHDDRHAGELETSCQACHTTETFRIARYRHKHARALRDFFDGRHLGLRCAECHRPQAPRAGAPAGVISYRISTACASCHTDVHRGALGPDCGSCHRPDDLVLVSNHRPSAAARSVS